jgi:hypothetical protein
LRKTKAARQFRDHAALGEAVRKEQFAYEMSADFALARICIENLRFSAPSHNCPPRQDPQRPGRGLEQQQVIGKLGHGNPAS